VIDFSDDRFQTTVARARSLATTLEAISTGRFDPTFDTFGELAALAVSVAADLTLVP
jgi:hypothetical protein